MRLLTRQFGKSFASALAKSPTLVGDLEECRRQGVRIRRLKNKCLGYSIECDKFICIGTKCSRSIALTMLAHEIDHVLRGTAPLNDIPPGMSRKRFVRLLLEEEVDCMEYELKVVGELKAAGVRLDGYTLSRYRSWKRYGRAMLRRRVEKLETSTTGERYPKYYGRIYDEAMAARRRSRK